MLFNSMQFVVFFLMVLLIYYLLPKKIRYIWLLITSYVFYMGWNVKYVLLLFTMTLTTYLVGLGIEDIRKKTLGETKKKNFCKLFLLLGILMNIGFLVYFKYMNFFMETIGQMLEWTGAAVSIPKFYILLPAGISFISFQSLGYAIDVYRGKIKAEKNILKYALFVSFFPLLLAGPIERSGNLLYQIQNVHNQKRMTYKHFTDGLVLMLFGYFQKVVIADKIAIVVETIFSNPQRYSAIVLAFGTIGFAIQLYCDFGGYSNIAIGAARVLGFDMMENFDTPYFASSIKDFWRRWHISLSTWFRDYVYIPLGGNRCSKWKKYCNLMITFLVSGLWHGASGHFVVWGALHGAYQIIEEEIRLLLKRLNIRVNEEKMWIKIPQIVCTFTLINITYVFFRADNIELAIDYLKLLFTKLDFSVFANGIFFELGLLKNDFVALLICVCILFVIDLLRYVKGMRLEVYLNTQKLWVKWTVLLVLIFCVVIFGEYGLNYDTAEFIYFQF